MHVSATIPSIPARRLPGRTYDRQFFLAVILLEVGAVALGFWPTYYGAGVFLAPLPSLIVHIHGAVFSLWMVLLFIPFTDAFDFAALTGCAYALRRNGPAHKRLIILATAGLSGAAFFRWHLAILFHNGQAAYAASYVFLLLLIVYDLWSTHRVHRATAWGGTFLVLMEQSTRIVGPSAPWHRVIHWVQTWSV
jgi:membrane protein YdbS with pleckstrin-like domain